MSAPKSASLFSLLKEYKLLVGISLVFSIGVNVLNLTLPQLIRGGIDAFTNNTLVLNTLIFQFASASVVILVLMYIEAILQSYVAERVARDLRRRLSSKIADEPTHLLRLRHLRSYLQISHQMSMQLKTLYHKRVCR